ncbi:MAG: FG-GAP-like repeat-containing protein [Phycisphaerales bacterium JB040]
MRAVATIALFCVHAAPTLAQSTCGPLYTDRIYTDGADIPSDIVFADVNDDGVPDMVVADQGIGVGVHLGTGDGTFGARTDYDMGFVCQAVTLGDIDGDGDLDMVCASGYSFDECDPEDPECEPGGTSNSVSIRRNNGDGTFGARTELPAGIDPRSVVLADLDNDTDLDLVAAMYEELFCSVWFNDGSGAFGSRSNTVIGFGATGLDAGDVDGDGDTDLVFSREFSNAASVLLNTGTGSFAPVVDYPVGAARPSAVLLADLDNDSDPEMLVPYQSGDRVRVYWNDGSGGYAVSTTFNAGDDPTDVVVIDLNQDGFLDVLTPNSGVRTISYSLNNGDQTFAARQWFEAGGAGALAVSDLNADGLQDLGMANDVFNTGYSVRLNTPDGFARDRDDYQPLANPLSISAADLDGDGDLDLAVSRLSSTGPNVATMMNTGDGTLAPATTFTAGSIPYVTTGDVNGDGDADLVTVNLSSASASVFLNNGSGGFGAPVAYPIGSSPRAPLLADLDGDGSRDVIATRGASVSFILNSGVGAFGSPVDIAVSGSPLASAAGDLDGDGDTDLVVPGRTSNNVTVYFNNGSASFSAGVPVGLSSSPYDIALADLDADGDLDVITANNDFDTAFGSVTVLLNDGAGGLGGGGEWEVAPSPQDVWVADIDGDGDPDVLTASNAINGYTVLYNNGSGSMAAREDYTDGRGTRAIVTGDLNSDGSTDVVTAQDGGFVTVHFASPCESGCEADVNGDGVLDNGDIGTFVQLFLANDLAADFNGDEILDNGDIGAFVAAFLAGC